MRRAGEELAEVEATLPTSPMTLEAVQSAVREHGISTCTISDVLDGLGVSNAVLDSTLRRLSGGTGMFLGVALPVSWAIVRKGPRITAGSPSTWAQVRDFVVPEVTDGSGRIYVAGAGRLVTDAALAGGLSLTYLLRALHFEGAVLGGAVRDRALVEANGFPVAASNFVPTDTQGAFRVQSVNEACMINNVTIYAGDWVFSDGNGTVVVPPHLLDEVVRAAAAIERTERQILERILAGQRLPEIIDEIGRI
jgi:regulator of RNase E activity RraA